jgi:S-adenosylmethionine hydrolase
MKVLPHEMIKRGISMNASIKPAVRPTVALLTDFGGGDGDVGVMKGVIARIVPEVLLIDITHEVSPQNVASAAWILASSYRYFPARTVFVCVIDPGVGSSRRAIALHAGEWFFVGPDNGLFSYIMSQESIHSAVCLTNPVYHLPQVSSTFHGRDIFAPTGAHLASNADEVFAKLGPSLDPQTLISLSTLNARRRGTAIEASILHVDRFGNLITSIPLSMVPELFSARHVQITFPTRGVIVEQRRRFFADGEENHLAFIYGDSSGYVGVAVRNGSAANILELDYGLPITFDTSIN